MLRNSAFVTRTLVEREKAVLKFSRTCALVVLLSQIEK